MHLRVWLEGQCFSQRGSGLISGVTYGWWACSPAALDRARLWVTVSERFRRRWKSSGGISNSPIQRASATSSAAIDCLLGGRVWIFHPVLIHAARTDLHQIGVYFTPLRLMRWDSCRTTRSDALSCGHLVLPRFASCEMINGTGPRIRVKSDKDVLKITALQM